MASRALGDAFLRTTALVAALAVCGGTASAQTPSPPAASASMEGVTLGEPMSQVRETLGNPAQVLPVGERQMWRYVEHNGSVFVDVIPENDIVISVTVIRRVESSTYVDDRGVAFGMSSGDVQAKLGAATKQSTNSDDGSVDLWYLEGDVSRIYEFYGDKLGFLQIVARPGSQLRRSTGVPQMQASPSPAPSASPTPS